MRHRADNIQNHPAKPPTMSNATVPLRVCWPGRSFHGTSLTHRTEATVAPSRRDQKGDGHIQIHLDNGSQFLYYARHRVKSKLWRYFPPTTPLDLDVCRISRSHETWLLGPTPPPTKPHQTGSHRQSQTKVLLGILYLAPRSQPSTSPCLNKFH